ncbi:MAG: hypothetical protein QXJ32_08320 [Thermoplasmata archaeon]
MSRWGRRNELTPLFVTFCMRLSSGSEGVMIPRSKHARKRLKRLETDLRLAGLVIQPELVLKAANRFAAILGVLSMAVAGSVLILLGTAATVAASIPLALMPLMTREYLLGYPAKAAKRRQEEVLRGAVAGVNMMVMSLRYEPSMPGAMVLASRASSDFAEEVKMSLWSVIMGKHASFEDAVLSIGEKWQQGGSYLKTALNSMVTACREATEDGRRRALDRANAAVISGARQRIEEYALSLSVPTMLIFGLGILLPLMVGSFLPMLSWDIWSFGGVEAREASSPGFSVEAVVVMNVLFPGIASFIAFSAVSGHPLERPGTSKERGHGRTVLATLAVVLFSVAGGLGVWWLADPSYGHFLALLASVLPISLWMVSVYPGPGDAEWDESAVRIDDVLFRTGARMQDGENFESALCGSVTEGGRVRSPEAYKLLGHVILSPQGRAPWRESRLRKTELESLRISRQAAAKDEFGAGTLAMDIAAYMKDFRDLEASLRIRLRPTISMMKTTSMVLAPVVLGVTYVIYLTLGSMMDRGMQGGDAGAFFLVLGMFLAEMDAIVVYFVWGVDGGRGIRSPVMYFGTCLAISELTYATTALLASGL